MGRVRHTVTDKKKLQKKKPTVMPVEERLQIIANLIVDRIIEDQKHGIDRTSKPTT